MTTTDFTNSITLTDAAWFDDADKAAYAYLTGVSGTNTIAGTGSAALSAYAAGQEFRFVPAATNTGATTINITQSGASALGAKNIYFNGAACVGGEIKIGVPVIVVYDGTQFNIAGGALSVPINIVDAKGDLIVATAADTVARKAVGTNGYSLAADSTQSDGLIWTPYATSSPNAIINGDFRVAQRGTSFADTNGYALDRWYVNRTGSVAGVTASQVLAAFSEPKYSMRVQRAAGNTSTASAAIYQAIEIKNCAAFAGTNACVSFRIGTGGNLSTTSHLVYGYYHTASDDRGPGGSWSTIGTVAFTLAASSSPELKTAIFAVPSTATQFMVAISIEYAGTAGADDSVYLSDFQVTPGTVALPFQRRDVGTELALCQRYYEKTYDVGTVPGTATGTGAIYSGQFAAATSPVISWMMQTTKRTTPSLTTYSVLGTSGALSDALTSDQTSLVNATGTKIVQVFITTGSLSLVQGHIVASAEL